MRKRFISILFLLFCPAANAETFSKIKAVTERAAIECYSDIGEYSISQIETAINKARYNDHSFDDYDKFLISQIVSAEENKKEAKNKWLKSQKGKKAVLIAKVYFDNECLIDQINAREMAKTLDPLINDQQTLINTKISNEKDKKPNKPRWEDQAKEIIETGEWILRGLNLLRGLYF